MTDGAIGEMATPTGLPGVGSIGRDVQVRPRSGPKGLDAGSLGAARDAAMTTAAPQRRDRFRHEALLYAGDEEFVEECAAFVADGVAEDEAVMVVVAAPKIDRLRTRLGSYGRHGALRGHVRSRSQPESDHRGVATLLRRPSGRTVPRHR